MGFCPSVTQLDTWVGSGLPLVRPEQHEVFVNEAHPAGGMALMSRNLGEAGAVPASP